MRNQNDMTHAIPALDTDLRLNRLRAEEQSALQSLSRAALRGNLRPATWQLARAAAMATLRTLTEQLAERGQAAGLTYMVGSLFLYDCHKMLVQGPDERMHYVTGLQLGNLLTLDRIVEFELDESSPASATGNLASSHAELVRLDRFGHRLHGLFHRHPGSGKEATRPSGVDLDTQSRQERGKYPVIGAIFTEDGFVTFFSAKTRFDVIPYGEGVEQVEETTYRLTQIS